MSRFYNPYFFLPLLEGRDDGDQCVAFDTIRSGAHDHIRHDLYHPDRNTGTITCTITTKTPTLVGNRHISGRKDKSPGDVEPYDVAGKPAFPASSLNGMIGSVMEALSRSSLRVLGEDFIEDFQKIHPNLVSWRRNRTHLTPAEQILGVVAEDDEEGEKTGQVHSLAGRLRLTDALPKGKVTRLSSQTLKILSSPKAKHRDRPFQFYYHHVAGSGENDQGHGKKNVPNGRKYYLHQQGSEMKQFPPTGNKKYWWETKDGGKKNIHQKIKCRLIDKEQKFSFEIRFHNLTDAELGLLLASIEPLRAAAVVQSGKPQAEEYSGGEFWHRLGLGKPLGLGSVKVELESLEIEAIRQGYTQWSAKPPVVGKEKKPKTDGYLRSAVEAGLIDEKVLEVLVALGDPEKVDAVVTYPVTQQQYEALQKGEAGGERELFKWFGSTAEQLVPDDFWQTPGGFHLSGRKLTAHANPGKNGGGGGRRGGGNRQAGRGSDHRPSGKKNR